MNNHLECNQEIWKTRLSDFEKRSSEQIQEKESLLMEMEGQVRDLMLHLDSAHKLNELNSSELSDGAIISINAPPATPTPSPSATGPQTTPRKGKGRRKYK